jgi:hypothetical protein
MTLFKRSTSEPTDVYQQLRLQALESSRAPLGLPPMDTDTKPWGVAMDWGMAGGSATIVAFSGTHRHPLSLLGDAIEEIGTQYRLIPQ